MSPNQAIPEGSSVKAKRGRPREYPADLIRDTLKDESAITDRGAREWLQAANAYWLILTAWKAAPTETAWAEYYIGPTGRGPLRRKTIAAALGRMEDESDMLKTAQVIAEKKIPARRVVPWLRRMRLGQEEDRPDYMGLFKHLECAVNAYVAKYPSTPQGEIARALRDVADCVVDADGDKAGP